jgi:hypothetical protein
MHFSVLSITKLETFIKPIGLEFTPFTVSVKKHISLNDLKYPIRFRVEKTSTLFSLANRKLFLTIINSSWGASYVQNHSFLEKYLSMV